ncbi:2'-5' RNA ligase family protein [Candidatus Gracilibacteria bacterium]|nr:2'-5' RNA ligase family protein [Candidatus Gracilibacteria bacterium]
MIAAIFSKGKSERASEVQPCRQLSLFITDGARGSIEALRQRYDPASAARIAAHVTLLYDIAPADLPGIAEALTVIGQEVAPFRLQLGPAALWEAPEHGIYLAVADVDGGFFALRQRLIADRAEAERIKPHVTLLHGRSAASQGARAWQALRHSQMRLATRIDHIALIEEAAEGWQILVTVPLQGASDPA